MSFYGRFFKPEEKLTHRRVLDRVGVFTAVECKAYIESNRQALYHLHSIQQDDGSVKFDLEENKAEQEKYINSTLLLEPKNEEAMYLLIDIELKRSNFSKVEELKKNFKKICLSMCEKLASINSRLKELE